MGENDETDEGAGEGGDGANQTEPESSGEGEQDTDRDNATKVDADAEDTGEGDNNTDRDNATKVDADAEDTGEGDNNTDRDNATKVDADAEDTGEGELENPETDLEAEDPKSSTDAKTEDNEDHTLRDADEAKGVQEWKEVPVQTAEDAYKEAGKDIGKPDDSAPSASEIKEVLENEEASQDEREQAEKAKAAEDAHWKKVEDYYRENIDNAPEPSQENGDGNPDRTVPNKKDWRYGRYKELGGSLDPAEWGKKHDNIRKNQEEGLKNERAARSALADVAEVGHVEDNNKEGLQRTFTHIDDKGRMKTTRPDSIREPTIDDEGDIKDGIVHEHKHFRTRDGDKVVYNDAQIKAQKYGTDDGKGGTGLAGDATNYQHVLTISADHPPKNLENEDCPIRPTANAAEDSEVYYYDNKAKEVTHQWDRNASNGKGLWRKLEKGTDDKESD